MEGVLWYVKCYKGFKLHYGLNGDCVLLVRETTVRAEVSDFYRVAVYCGAESAEGAGEGDFQLKGRCWVSTRVKSRYIWPYA